MKPVSFGSFNFECRFGHCFPTTRVNCRKPWIYRDVVRSPGIRKKSNVRASSSLGVLFIVWSVWGITLSYTAAVDRDEVRAAEAHIARLEGELLRLKDVKRQLQSLREEHQNLRRSVEG